jgi:hypothetical protein
MMTHPRVTSFWFLFTNFSHPEYDWNIAYWALSNQSINQFAHFIVSSSIDVSTLLLNINIPWSRAGDTGTLFFLSFSFLFCISFFLYSFISSFFSIVTFLGWFRLHATWIKPEVVATKKYTGYLHYRFITTGSRFLWSPFLFQCY